MKAPELKNKYGKDLIERILKGSYLEGCTIAIINGEEDIPESDIQLTIRKINNKKSTHGNGIEFFYPPTKDTLSSYASWDVHIFCPDVLCLQ